MAAGMMSLAPVRCSGVVAAEEHIEQLFGRELVVIPIVIVMSVRRSVVSRPGRIMTICVNCIVKRLRVVIVMLTLL